MFGKSLFVVVAGLLSFAPLQPAWAGPPETFQAAELSLPGLVADVEPASDPVVPEHLVATVSQRLQSRIEADSQIWLEGWWTAQMQSLLEGGSESVADLVNF